MSEIQHKSLRDEILYVLGRSTIALNGSEIYERCTLADEMKQVSNAVFQLKAAGKIVAADGEGRPRYKLADGVAAPAPAGKVGRPPIADPDAAPVTTKPTVEIPTLGAPVSPAGKNPGPKPKAKPVEIVRAPGEGRARYMLAEGVSAPAPAGKSGHSKATRAHVACGTPPATVTPAPGMPAGLPALDIPGLGDALTGLNGAAGKTMRREPDCSPTPPDEPVDTCVDQGDAALADAILDRLKRQLAPTLAEMEAAVGLDRINVHVHIEQVDIHLGGL